MAKARGFTLLLVKCPVCGADVSIEIGAKQKVCPGCGTSVTMTRENEYTFHIVDEAKIKQAETDRIVQLKKLEMEEQERKNKSRGSCLEVIIKIVAWFWLLFS